MFAQRAPLKGHLPRLLKLTSKQFNFKYLRYKYSLCLEKRQGISGFNMSLNVFEPVKIISASGARACRELAGASFNDELQKTRLI